MIEKAGAQRRTSVEKCAKVLDAPRRWLSQQTMKANSKSAAGGKESIVVNEEMDKFGIGTGHFYYECTCGAELMTGRDKDKLPHKAGCPLGDA